MKESRRKTIIKIQANIGEIETKKNSRERDGFNFTSASELLPP